jgi:hypothetical protein
MDIRDFPDVKGYANVEGMGLVAVLTEDVAGLTYVARWVRSDKIKDMQESLVGELPEDMAKYLERGTPFPLIP